MRRREKYPRFLLDTYHDIYYRLHYTLIPTKGGDKMPQTAKIFQNGRSQAIRLPKEFRFEGKDFFIRKEGDNIILSAKPQSWDAFFLSKQTTSPDFMKNRADLDPEERVLFE